MKTLLRRLLCYAAAAAAVSSLMPNASAQKGGVQVIDVVPNPNQPISVTRGLSPAKNRAALQASGAAATIPLWNYSILASRDGNTYQGVMVGTDPFAGGGTTTMVQSPIIPVKVILGPYTYDPTVPDPCLAAGMTVRDLATNSPMFNASDYVMNGVDVGNTQYIDAFQRSNFWALVGGTDYHMLLQPMVQAAQTYIPASGFVTNALYCGDTTREGLIEINAFDSWVRNVALPGAGVDPTQFPVILLQNVVMYDGVINNCCIGGYHAALGNFQTYSPSNVDTTGFFTSAPDIAILSHEVGEWLDDPLGNNQTPAWGNIGQVVGCQGNLEVGDPLTGTLFPPVMMNGFSYNPQELAHFNWFFGDDVPLGSGGLDSNNGTFTQAAQACP
jgi:hypothetical protein